MKFATNAFCVALLAGGLLSSAVAQSSPAAAKPEVETRFFHLANTSAPNDANEILTGIRLMVMPSTKIYLEAGQNVIIVQGTPGDLAMAERIITELDKSRKTYRLIYTVETYDAGKRVGEQHYALVVAMGTKATLKSGNRLPIAAGAKNTDTAATNTQYTYMDVGLNIDAALDPSGTGARLNSKIEQSSVAEEKPVMSGQDPIVRQSVIQGTSFLAVGKPVKLGSLDMPGSTRHLEIEVVMEPLP